jgi:putative transposase
MKEDEFRLYRGNLPHWRMERGTYFVTWRIGDGQPDLTPAERDDVAEALRHFNNTRYRLAGYVIMNDHVHVVVEPADGHRLEAIVHSWKSFTAHRFVRTGSRKGSVWQKEYFDRILRSELEMAEKLQYMLENPWRRWPGIEDYAWMWLAE